MNTNTNTQAPEGHPGIICAAIIDGHMEAEAKGEHATTSGWATIIYRHVRPYLAPQHAAMAGAPQREATSTEAPHSDDLAVDRFSAAMKVKLATARKKGRGGWETCDPVGLLLMLRQHVEKGDPLDVANFCMFLWSRGRPISPAAEPHEHAVQAVSLEPTNAQLRAYIDEFVTAGNTSMEGMLRGAVKRFAAQAPTAVQASDTGSTPGEWFVRKLERDGKVLDCFVAAPDCQGMAYGAEILGDDEYRDGIERKLADATLIVNAVRFYRAALATAAVQGDASSVPAPVVTVAGQAGNYPPLPEPFDTVNRVSPEGQDYDVSVFDAAQVYAAIDADRAALAAASSVQPAIDQSAAYRYARWLAEAIRARHYPEATQWEPFEGPDLLGVLTQIDNMTSGLVRTLAAPGPAASSAVPAVENIPELWSISVTDDGDVVDLVITGPMGKTATMSVDSEGSRAEVLRAFAAASPALAPEQSHG